VRRTAARSHAGSSRHLLRSLFAEVLADETAHDGRERRADARGFGFEELTIELFEMDRGWLHASDTTTVPWRCLLAVAPACSRDRFAGLFDRSDDGSEATVSAHEGEPLALLLRRATGGGLDFERDESTGETADEIGAADREAVAHARTPVLCDADVVAPEHEVRHARERQADGVLQRAFRGQKSSPS